MYSNYLTVPSHGVFHLPPVLVFNFKEKRTQHSRNSRRWKFLTLHRQFCRVLHLHIVYVIEREILNPLGFELVIAAFLCSARESLALEM